MGMEAVGAYLLEIRTRKGMTREELSAQVGASTMTLFRIEERGQEPRAMLFSAIIQAVGAPLEEAQRLLLDSHATAIDGKMAAARWMERQADQYSLAIASEVMKSGDHADVQALIALLKRAVARMQMGEHAISALAKAVYEQKQCGKGGR